MEAPLFFCTRMEAVEVWQDVHEFALVLGTRGLFSQKPITGGVAEWSIAPVLKTGEPQGSVGSNPTSSASLDFADDPPQIRAAPLYDPAKDRARVRHRVLRDARGARAHLPSAARGDFIRDGERVAHSRRCWRSQEALRRHLMETENARRGYLLVADPRICRLTSNRATVAERISRRSKKLTRRQSGAASAAGLPAPFLISTVSRCLNRRSGAAQWRCGNGDDPQQRRAKNSDGGHQRHCWTEFEQNEQRDCLPTRRNGRRRSAARRLS